MTGKLLIFFLLFCCIILAATAQVPATRKAAGASRPPVSNLHQKFIPVRSVKLIFDSLSIIPNTFVMVGISEQHYLLDFVNAGISWRQKPNLDSVYISYRTFPYKLNSVVKRLNYDSIRDNFIIQPSVYAASNKQGNDNFFNFGNLTYNGSFGRAIAFGNSQDAVVTSNLNLQISGFLADSIEINAAITDNNIPIQPDGTTAQISDFDKIFLEFKKKTWDLSMGDIDLRQNQNYFLSFYKRLEGANFETLSQIDPHTTNKLLVSGAVAKGTFNRNIFQGQEGNQGPYPLQGANNELYFTVLAGTEKVFLDGILLQRGQDQDYVINYNTAQVTFTQRHLITQDSRIQVEFEYSNQNYLNTNLYLYDEANFNKRFKLRFGVLNNSDARNSPINQTLTPDQIKFLSLIGDSVDKAYYPYAPVDTLGPGKVLYQKVDTVYKASNGLYVHDSVYEYSVNPNVVLYNLSFANVGAGNGDYVPNLDGINGSVYMWVAPVNGQHQGSFAAAQFLVTPKTQRVITLGADYVMSKNTAASVDFGTSHYDVNTLSSLGKSNDNGSAVRLQLSNVQPISSASRGLTLTSKFSYEYVDASFQPVEPLRPVEFSRTWGLPLQVPPADETLYSAAFTLGDKKKNSLTYEFSGYDRGTSFTGIKNQIAQSQDVFGWLLKDAISLTNDDQTTSKGYYFFPSIGISKTIKSLANYSVGINYSGETNDMKDKTTDTVISTSYAYQTVQAFIKSPEKSANNWGMSLTTRENAYPYQKSLVKGDKSQNINLFTNLLHNKHHQFRLNATYRSLEVVNPTVTTQQADKTILGRAEYAVDAWKGLITGNALYEVGSGQEQKLAFTYVQVPTGTGQYEWIDMNKDGIQQLNEFVLAQFPDQANFIRVFTPSNIYIRDNYTTFNYGIRINPKAVINPKSKGLQDFLGRIIFQSSLQLNQKQQANSLATFNPTKKPLNDTSLISEFSIFSNTLSFNKNSTRWGFDLSNNLNKSKTLLTYGYQSQQIKQWNLRARLSLTKAILLNATLQTGTSLLLNSYSDFDSSNYNLSQYSIEPDISYNYGANLRATIGYIYSNKTNMPIYGGEIFSSQSLTSDIKYNILQSTSLEAKFALTNINYNGNPNSTVSYVMLGGLLPGNNYLWSLNFTKKLGTNLEMSLQYDGRKASDSPLVNTGRASLKAIL